MQILDDWLEERRHNVPDELYDRVREMVGEQLPLQLKDTNLAHIVQVELGRLIKDGLERREKAGDLLAIDAVATYFFLIQSALGEDGSEAMISSLNEVAAQFA